MRCFLLALAIAPLAEADAGALRPYAARHQAHQHHHQHHAAAAPPAAPVVAPVAPVVAPVAPVVAPVPEAPLPTLPAVAAAPVTPPVVELPREEPAPMAVPVAPVAEDVASGDVQSSVAVRQLRSDLAEVKQLHGNVATLEKTLAADVNLLRESATLQRVSNSPRGRKSAKEQVRQAEQMVRDTEVMVRQSREDAAVGARAALSEAQAARKAADALSAEASAQLKLLLPRQAREDVAALQTSHLKGTPKAAPKVIRLAQIVHKDEAKKSKDVAKKNKDDDDDDDEDDASM